MKDITKKIEGIKDVKKRNAILESIKEKQTKEVKK